MSDIMEFGSRDEFRKWLCDNCLSSVGIWVLFGKVSDGELRETQMTNYFSNLYPIDCAVLSVNAQSYRKYGTLPEHEFLPEI